MSTNPTATLTTLCLLLCSGAGAAHTISSGGSTGIALDHGRTHPLPTGPMAALDLWTFDLTELATVEVVEATATAQTGPVTTPLAAAPQESESVGHADARQAGSDTGQLVYRSLIHGDQEHHATLSRWGLGSQTRLTGFLAARDTTHRGPRQRGSEETLRGVLVARTLASPTWADLQLSGGWLSGTVPTGVVDSAATGRSGNTWSLAGRAALPTEGLSLSFEYAGTRVQPEDGAPGDGIEGQGARSPIIGQAYAAGAELRPVGETAAAWRLGTEFRWVGPDFESVANPTLTRDRARLRSFAGLGGEDWRIDLRLDRERDNLSQRPDAPTKRRDRAELATSWRPGLPRVSEHLGKPRVKLVAGIDRNHARTATAPDAGSQDLKRRLRLESEFHGEGWRWGITAAREALERIQGDGATGDARTTSLRLYGDASPAGSLPLRPSVAWRRHEDAGGVDRSWRAELRTPPISLGRGLRANLDLGYLRRWQVDSGDGGQRLDMGGSLSWTLQRPSSTHSGLALTVSGKAVSDEAPAAADVDYRLTLSLSTSNPLAGW